MQSPFKLTTDVRLTAGLTAESGPPEKDAPFRILVLADFGRGSGGPTPPARIDRDTFESVMARWGIGIRLDGLPLAGGGLDLVFQELDDFTPDRIADRLPRFQHLSALRKRLDHPTTFAAAAEEVKRWSAAPAEPAPTAPQPTPIVPPSDPASLLQQMLGGPSASAAPSTPIAFPGGGDWETFLRQVVAGSTVPGVDPRRDELIGQVDAAANALMRAILHHPRFRAVEAAWRGLWFLLRRLDTDGSLRLYAAHLPRLHLATDMGSDDLAGTATYKLLTARLPNETDERPWAVVVGDMTFGPTLEDAELLARISLTAAAGKTTFLAAADPRLVGCPNAATLAEPRDWTAPEPTAAAAWAFVRRLPTASRLGLALPRFLIRSSYGTDNLSTEVFPFEELPDDPTPEIFAWGNPAFAWAWLLGQAFQRRGWRITDGLTSTLTDLPAPVYRADGAKQLRPPAEVILTDTAAGKLLDAGLAPLSAESGTDRVRFYGLPSLADPPAPLAGRWA